jgi:hypothetical protein
MAETKKQETVQKNEKAEPVERDLNKELEVAYKENSELREQNNQLREAAQKLFQENQTLRASLKAIASLL